MLGMTNGAFAQTATRLELFGGYSYLHDPAGSILDATSGDSNFVRGWVAGAAESFKPWLAVVGEVARHTKTRTTYDGDVSLALTSFLGGARLSAPIGLAREFAQVLVGAVRGSGSAFGFSDSSTSFSAQGGGGLDVPLTQHFKTRFELDYRRISGSKAGRVPANQLRAVAAIVFVR